MNRTKPKTREQRLADALESVKSWKAGKSKLRTWEVGNGNRSVTYQSYSEYKQEKQAGAKIKEIRKKLGLSQKHFAEAMRTSVRTLQGWEIGKSIPTPALVLAELLRDSQDVRRRLMSPAA